MENAEKELQQLSLAEAEAKSKNAEKNEAKRKAKLEKFLAKQAALEAKKAAAGSQPEKKKKEPKEKPAAPKEEVFVNTTPIGEKKDLSAPLAAAYNPKAVESAWYEWWEKEGHFKPEFGPDGKVKPAGAYVIPAPPPNVTGSLHIGHALTVSIQDTLIRWNRMLGKTTLFNPGCDHAGIATQAVVEKQLWRNDKLSRHDLGREKFVEKVWEWKQQYGDRIYHQLKRLGGSFDWERARFTLDPELCDAVTETFVQLHEEGVIYRANRLVNWSVKLNTALSNLEVENKELPGRTLLSIPGHDAEKKYEFGVLISFIYQVENSDEKIIVATTRIETMLGDTAVAVHPKDERYKHLHGKYVIHPFNGRRIPIVCDDIIVDMAFGTGAVKITPAHDFNDYEVGKRHNLEFINILNDNGTLNANAAPFEGLKRFDAREAVLAALKEKGLYVETVDNPMSVPICTRSGDIIEPLMKPQWYVRCKEMANEAMKVVVDGELEIQPKASEKEWFRWLENIQDWCVSRQLWWGHRVPAYFVNIEGETHDANDDGYWVSGRTLEEAQAKAEAKFAGKKFTLEQDPDVLDTWFSSGLWPFSIMGWPKKTLDFDNFYPSSLLETGWDILFFWVARMVMLGIKLTGKSPFKQIFCHAMIRDAHGRKMSKSLGNVIDPIDVIEGITLEALHYKLDQGNLDPREAVKAKAGQQADFPNGIPECGTDALRFALCAYTSTGRDINLDILRVEGYRKFCNKLWNVTRFALMKLGEDFKPRANAELTGNESLPELWILHKLNKAAATTNAALNEKNFMAATSAIYSFWLYELCDVFVEVIKPITDDSSPENATQQRSAKDTLYTCLEAGLKLLHPFMPFVTEELYQRLPRRPEDSIPTISKASYPVEEASYDNDKAEKDFDNVFSIVKAARSLIVEYNISSNAQIYITVGKDEMRDLLAKETRSIVTLTKGCKQAVVLGGSDSVPAGCALATVTEDINVLLMIKGQVDIDAEVEKLNKKLEKVQTSLTTLNKKISIPDYESKVRADIREMNETKIKGYQSEIEGITNSIQNFLSLKD
ncbi:valine--tRNA ligase [Basidiobolus ranarum]|uniref:valine--tRNA ligase n=1 Tax=Basidiobolus ranarum TaxID=34480 RepID=A0ABR2VY87_9FUNG